MAAGQQIETSKCESTKQLMASQWLNQCFIYSLLVTHQATLQYCISEFDIDLLKCPLTTNINQKITYYTKTVDIQP